VVRRPRGKVVHADLKGIAKRLECSKSTHQDRITPDPPYLWLSIMAIVEAVDWTGAFNRWTLGVMLNEMPDGKIPSDPRFPEEIHSASGYIET
jgi:hypothetical protein